MVSLCSRSMVAGRPARKFHPMFDLNHPFYKPLWIRIAIVTLCLGWATLELVQDNPGWAMVFGALGLYCIYALFLNFRPRDE